MGEGRTPKVNPIKKACEEDIQKERRFSISNIARKSNIQKKGDQDTRKERNLARLEKKPTEVAKETLSARKPRVSHADPVSETRLVAALTQQNRAFLSVIRSGTIGKRRHLATSNENRS